MKYVVVLADGMADYPIEELGGKTPLEYARTPHLDFLAQAGEMGMVRTIPPGMPPGSDVANLAVLGYDPSRYYTGRSPLEAVSMGVELAEEDVAFRCNLVTLSEAEEYSQKEMVDYSADEISTEEARQLMQEVSRQLGTDSFAFYAGISYRHLMVWRQGSLEVILTPPHDIPGRKIGEYLPQGRYGGVLKDLMERSARFLPQHPVNKERAKRGLHPANSIWFWGEGRRPALPTLEEKYGIKGSVVCAVDLVRGLGICAGLKPVAVPGATGGTKTNFRGKAEAAVTELLGGQDFVFLHIEAPDEAGHRGELDTKIQAIEEIDAQVIGVIRDKLEGVCDFRLLVLPDHPTPLSVRTHVAEEVPFVIYEHCGHKKGTSSASSKGGEGKGNRGGFNEAAARATGWRVEEGYRLMDIFLRPGRL